MSKHPLISSCAVFLLTSQQTLGFSPAFQSSSTLSHSRSGCEPLQANLITFDLDDTIFPVGPVVADANKALFQHLIGLGCSTTENEYLKTTKAIRVGLAGEGKAITYTELRQRAIREEMTKYLDEADIQDDIVLGAYNIWEDHRHMAAEKHLYSDTIEMLRELKDNNPDVVIAAITNGKGNPLRMESISEYFDYCVSGEDDDVFPLRKPNEGIYNVALKRFEELSSKDENESSNGSSDERCWIHVGDDLANDVGASAQCGAHAIWVDLEEEYNQTASKRDPNAPQPAWSTATKEELEKRKLMNEQAQKYVTKRITSLDQLPMAVETIKKATLQIG